MSYCILPKKINLNYDILNVAFLSEQQTQKPIISNNITNLKNDILKLINIENIELLNTYFFIHNQISDFNLSVSKLVVLNNNYYVLIELLNTINILELFNQKNITTFCFSQYPDENLIANAMEKLVANETFTLTNYNETISNNNFDLKIKCNNNSIDFLYFELPLEMYKQQKTYIVGLLHILCHILTLQKNNGICIIKIDDLIYQPIIEILFLLTNMFDKICIIKPIVTNNISNEKFLLCKHFSFDNRQEKLLKNIKSIINESNNSYEIASLLNIKLPYYFINKLEESNITIGNQQIEYCDLLINIIKHKNKDYKLEMLKKSNIQKCIDWCEKYKIPHNKFIDKLNIFLSSSI